MSYRKRQAGTRSLGHQNRRLRGRLDHRGWYEPLEVRWLLTADFLPAAADAMADGFDDFQDRLNEFFDNASDLDRRVPFLLLEDPNYDEENPDPDDAPIEAPTMGQLFSVPVDADGDDQLDDNLLFDDALDETTLNDWDTAGNSDGFVDTAEMFNGLLFDRLQDLLDSVDGATTTEEIVTAFEGDGFLNDGFDILLNQLGTDYELEFDLTSATDLTEDPDAEVAFSLHFELTITRAEVDVDFGLEADDLKLLVFTGDSLDPESVTLPVTSTLSFGLEFGVYTGGQNDTYGLGDDDLNAADFFIRRADDMLFSVTADEDPISFDLNIGFLGAEVVDGDIDFGG